MSDQCAPAAILPAKRRRGRPRKDGGVPKRGNCLSPPPPAPAPKASQFPLETNRSDTSALQSMVGKSVSGVIDGCFEAGYFLTIRVDNSDTLLRGLVFLPGRFTPVSASNDVAPQAKMYHRKDIPVPGPTATNNPPLVQNETDQPPPPPVSEAVTVPHPRPFSSEMTETPFSPPNITTVHQGQDQRFQIQTQTDQRPEILRTVEHDDVMQVFELSPPSKSQQLPENDGEDDTLLPDQSTGPGDSELTRKPTGDPGSQIDSNQALKSDSGQSEAPPAVEEPQSAEHIKQSDEKETTQKPEELIDSGIGQNGMPDLMSDHRSGEGRMDTHGLFGNPVVGGSPEFGFGIGDLVHPPHAGNPNGVGSPPATLND
ncbi:unnamed protein product [Cuscuta campestris]|uniref:Uncharacterized protein n=1 Tax=Cuscuta campestris TaxID=132261 RepID=A0A484N558_9ASTE|nr:unnamed protein product [Cuscuta campestris]